MSKTFKNVAKIAVKNARETDNGTITFAEPLAITDDSRQWNNTRYDIDSLDITPYDGTVTADHGQKISDVIGKIVNLRKEGNKILIDGIRFAVNENPLAVLAKNLMKGGFVTGVSIETIGDDPDDTLTWKNHALCGLSVVAHPNNKNAYAVISNSVAEAKSYGLKVDAILNALEENEAQMKTNLIKNETKLSKNLAFSAKKSYNNGMSELHNKTDQIINKLNGVITNATKGSNPIGNPWHDAQGRFTNSPLGAFHATTVHEASEFPVGSKAYVTEAHMTQDSTTYSVLGNNTAVVIEGQVDENGHPTLPYDSFGEEITLVNKNFTPEMAATQATVRERGMEIWREHKDGKTEADKMLKQAADMAGRGVLKDEQISALNTLLAAKTRAGSKNAKMQQEASDILAMNNTMKYVNQQYAKAGITGAIEKINSGKADLKNYTAYDKDSNVVGTPRYLKAGELYTQQYSSRGGEMEYKLGATATYKYDNGAKGTERRNISVGRVYKGSGDSEPDMRLETGSFGSVRGVKAGVYNITNEQFMAAQRTVFEDYQKELSRWM